MQVSLRRSSGPSEDAGLNENVASFVRALRGLQVPPDVVLRAEELTDPDADIRRLLRCLMFLKNSEEVRYVAASGNTRPRCSVSTCRRVSACREAAAKSAMGVTRRWRLAHGPR